MVFQNCLVNNFVFFLSSTTAAFPAECDYQPWAEWSECSEPCGKDGIQVRERAVLPPDGRCNGTLNQERKCFLKLCGGELIRSKKKSVCPLLKKKCLLSLSGALFGLDSILVELDQVAYSGSDNAWRIKVVWGGAGGRSCLTSWLDR